MNILDQLREAARQDGRPMTTIAAAAGIHHATFYTFLSGKRGLGVESAEQLAQALGRPLQLAPVAKPTRTRTTKTSSTTTKPKA